MLFIILVIIAIGAFIFSVAMQRQSRLARNLSAYNLGVSGFRLISVAALVLAGVQCFTVVPAGHVGVVDFLGYVSKQPLRAGVNLVNPLARVIKMTIKTQELKEQMEVPSREGLTVGLEASILYHLDPLQAPEVYKTIGENYVRIILVPLYRSVIRGVTAEYDAKALYTSMREEVANNIHAQLNDQSSKRGILVEATPLRQVILPRDLSTAIEEKLRAEQESQRMQFILTKERQEAERKRIEAQGIADFQRTVAEGISDQLLRWKGIEATENLAASANSKVVVIGSGKDGLPLILGGAN